MSGISVKPFGEGLSSFTVTPAAQRPASMNGHCFYCGQKIGDAHKLTCVLIQRKVKVRMTVELEIAVPADWPKELVESSRNEGSWCQDNVIQELERLSHKRGCLCGCCNFTFVANTSTPFLSEK